MCAVCAGERTNWMDEWIIECCSSSGDCSVQPVEMKEVVSCNNTGCHARKICSRPVTVSWALKTLDDCLPEVTQTLVCSVLAVHAPDHAEPCWGCEGVGKTKQFLFQVCCRTCVRALTKTRSHKKSHKRTHKRALAQAKQAHLHIHTSHLHAHANMRVRELANTHAHTHTHMYALTHIHK